MKNEQILKYRDLFEKAPEFAVFLDGIEASCSRESNAAFLRIQYEGEPGQREDDIAENIPLRSKALESLIERTVMADESSPLHRVMLTTGIARSMCGPCTWSVTSGGWKYRSGS